MPDHAQNIVFLLLAGVVPIAFGHLRLAATRKPSNNKRKKRLPRLPLGLGYSFLAALALVLGFILHGLYRLAELDSAIVTVREIVDAETRFAKSNPMQGYTCNLAELPTDGGILEQALAKTGQRNGYSFEIRGCQKIHGKPNSSYRIVARPLHDSDPRGRDNVCADQSGIVRFSGPSCDHE